MRIAVQIQKMLLFRVPIPFNYTHILELVKILMLQNDHAAAHFLEKIYPFNDQFQESYPCEIHHHTPETEKKCTGFIIRCIVQILISHYF